MDSEDPKTADRLNTEAGIGKVDPVSEKQFEKWKQKQEAKGIDWQGKLNRESQLAEKGLGSRVVGFHCPWCRYKTLYYEANGTMRMHCITCGLDWEIECISTDKLEQLKADKKLERVLTKESKDD